MVLVVWYFGGSAWVCLLFLDLVSGGRFLL